MNMKAQVLIPPPWALCLSVVWSLIKVVVFKSLPHQESHCCLNVIKRDREGERDTEAERERDGESERRGERGGKRERERHRGRERERRREREGKRERERQRARERGEEGEKERQRNSLQTWKLLGFIVLKMVAEMLSLIIKWIMRYSFYSDRRHFGVLGEYYLKLCFFLTLGSFYLIFFSDRICLDELLFWRPVFLLNTGNFTNWV